MKRRARKLPFSPPPPPKEPVIDVRLSTAEVRLSLDVFVNGRKVDIATVQAPVILDADIERLGVIVGKTFAEATEQLLEKHRTAQKAK